MEALFVLCRLALVMTTPFWLVPICDLIWNRYLDLLSSGLTN